MTYFWSHLEPSIAICTACLMTYKPLFCLPATRIPTSTQRLTTGPQNPNTGSSANRKTTIGSGIRNEGNWPLPPPPIRSRLQLDPRSKKSGQNSNLTGAGLELELLTKKVEQEKHRKTHRETEAQAYRGDEYDCSRIMVGEEASFV